MKLHINKYLKHGGYSLNNNSSETTDPLAFILVHLLGLCYCGSVSEEVDFLIEVLDALHIRQLNSHSEFSPETWDKDTEKLYDILDNLGASTFVFHTLEIMGLEEHGSSSPGWLTEKGIEVLEDLKTLRENEYV